MKYHILFQTLSEPKWMRRIHGWLTVFWITMVPIALISGLVESLIFISLISIYALAIGHFSSWQAARAEEAAIDGNSTEMVEEIHDIVVVDGEHEVKVDVEET